MASKCELKHQSAKQNLCLSFCWHKVRRCQLWRLPWKYRVDDQFKVLFSLPPQAISLFRDNNLGSSSFILYLKNTWKMASSTKKKCRSINKCGHWPSSKWKNFLFSFTQYFQVLCCWSIFMAPGRAKEGCVFFFFTFSTSFSGKAPQVKLQHQTTNHFLVWRLLSKLDANKRRQKNFKKIQWFQSVTEKRFVPTTTHLDFYSFSSK